MNELKTIQLTPEEKIQKIKEALADRYVKLLTKDSNGRIYLPAFRIKREENDDTKWYDDQAPANSHWKKTPVYWEETKDDDLIWDTIQKFDLYFEAIQSDLKGIIRILQNNQTQSGYQQK